MREIKFRAWDKEKMVHFTQKQWICSEYNSICWEVDEEEEKEYLGKLHLKEDYILMQYTGLKDKNGREIYEGDIVKAERSYWDEPRNLIVEWFGERYGLRNPKDNVDSEVMDKESCFNVSENEREIIGNIYENPNLIQNA